MTFTCECGLCGKAIKIVQESDGRFLHWPCHCAADRDVAVAEGLASIMDSLTRKSKPLAEEEKQS